MTKSKFSNIFYKLVLILIMVLGLFIRTKAFLINQSFWHDECALAWNILNKSYLELFSPLRFLQVAPPLFLIFTKILVQIFGSCENIFRLIPFISSLLSIFVFYLLTINLFSTKRAVLFANFLFTINFPLYYYATEFKPYSVDVLFCMLTLLIFIKLKPQYLFLSSLLLSVFIWISFPTAIFLLSGTLFLLLNKHYNLKQKLLFILPVILNSVLFYTIYFANVYNYSKNGMLSYWNENFLTINNLFSHLYEFIKFIFTPSIIIPLLIIAGLIMFLKENNKIMKISIIAILFLIVLSSLKFYPFSGRLILFLIPIIILLYTKPIDKKGIIIFILFLTSLIPQLNKTIDILKKKEMYKNNSNPREMVKFIKAQSKPTDIIYFNEASNADYLYYMQIFNLNNKYVLENINKLKKGDEVWIFIANKTDKNLINIIKNDFIITYLNASNDSLLAFGIKKK